MAVTSYILRKNMILIFWPSVLISTGWWLTSYLFIYFMTRIRITKFRKTWQISLSAKSLFRRKRSYIRILVHTYMVIHGWDCKDEPKPIQYDDPTVKFSLLLWIYSFHGFTEDSAKKETSLKFHRVVK